jgi:hypothetical protein
MARKQLHGAWGFDLYMEGKRAEGRRRGRRPTTAINTLIALAFTEQIGERKRKKGRSFPLHEEAERHGEVRRRSTGRWRCRAVLRTRESTVRAARQRKGSGGHVRPCSVNSVTHGLDVIRKN